MIKDVEQFAAEQSERMIYFAIDMCGAFIWQMNHDAGHGRLPPESIAGVMADCEFARQDQLVLITVGLPRFGLERPLDENACPTEEYRKWFRWWDQWKRGMSNEEWTAYLAAERRWGDDGPTPEEDKHWRPRGRWQDHDGQYR